MSRFSVFIVNPYYILTMLVIFSVFIDSNLIGLVNYVEGKIVYIDSLIAIRYFQSTFSRACY